MNAAVAGMSSAAQPAGAAGAVGTATMPVQAAAGTPAAVAGMTPPGATEGAAGVPAMMPPATDPAADPDSPTLPLGSPVPDGGLMCAAEVCKALPPVSDSAASMGFSIALCCTADGQCGTQQGGKTDCIQIPDSDPQCPKLEVMGFKIASCCTSDGKCGLNGTEFMMKDCGSLEEAIAMYGSFITFPDPRPCTPAPGGMTMPPSM
jgi:hypothetical protein